MVLSIIIISPVFVGSISDSELTRISGFLTTLVDKPSISIMADRGFTIKDMLKELNIDLNLDLNVDLNPFMEGKQQLSAEDVHLYAFMLKRRLEESRRSEFCKKPFLFL